MSRSRSSSHSSGPASTRSPILFANAVVAQFDPDLGAHIVTIGQVTLPALIGTPEEVTEQAAELEFVTVKAIARLAFTPAKLQEVIETLQANVDQRDARLTFVQEILGMTDSATILVQENVSRGPELVEIRGDSSASTARRRAPLFVPSGQLYYWTREWQNGEEDALRDLEEGRFETFPDETSAARWLLEDED